MNNRIVNANSAKINFIGKIRIGIKAKSASGSEYPKAVDYFVPTGNFAQFFTKTFGEKPSKFRIMFTNENALQQKYVLQDKELYGESDGLTVRYKDRAKKEWEEKTFQTPEAAAEFMTNYQTQLNKKGVKWVKMLVMDFVIPEIMDVFGFWRFETKAEKSMIDSITNMFDAACQLYGQINLVPFYLSVEMKDHKTFEENRKFPVVSLTPAINPVAYQAVMLNSLNPIQDLLQIQPAQQTQLSHASDEEKIFEEESVAVYEMSKCETLEQLKECWTKHKKFQRSENFINAKESKKAQLS